MINHEGIASDMKNRCHEKYIIESPLNDEQNIANVWADECVPFEAKDWRVHMRGDLRRTIGEIKAQINGVLYASYISNSLTQILRCRKCIVF